MDAALLFPYGCCPVCGLPGVSRERRPDGNDRCENGHTYPSRDAKPFDPPIDVAHAEAPDAEHCACVPALRAEIERLRTNAEARERVMRREADLLRAAQRAMDVLRKEAHIMRLWAEEAARAENANAEDVKRECAAVVAYLAARGGICLDLADDIERGEHRREEER